jgi:outer membrane protein
MSKKLTSALFAPAFIAAAVGVFAISAPAFAADPAPAPAAAAPSGEKLASPVIAAVDIQKIMQDSSASKGIQAAIESQRDQYQKEITSLEDKLRSAEQELRKQQNVLSADALGKKRKEFETQVAEVQRTVQNRKRSLDGGLNDAMSVVQKTMLEIIADVVREKGANVVLARHQFVIVDTKLDITDIVMDRLNAKLPKVSVTIPK